MMSGNSIDENLLHPRRRRLVWGCLGAVAYIALATGCGHTRKNLIFETRVALPSGRFVGPVEVEVPRQADYHGRDFEIRAELVATCGPLLHISYPDGEVSLIGDGNERWQSLLALRAENNESPAEPPAESPAEPPAKSPAKSPAEPSPSGTVSVSAPPGRGHWERVTTESWPGQLEFLRTREHRCSDRSRYARVYETGYDETGRVTVWAEVPQELGEAQLTVRVYETIDVDAEAEAEAEARARVGARERERVRAEGRRKQAADKAAARERKPKPPKPAPQRENPDPAEAEGATWSPGLWIYSPGEGKWVWASGHWLAPARTPGPKVEDHGPPPVADCTWQSGDWVWVQGPGRWDWVPGHWNAPPPRVEDRGQPPVPESPWISGRWVVEGNSFKWIVGYWGRPGPRDETIPPRPREGATWRAGTWLKVSGKWVWSPGFYEDSRRTPPPRKQESPGARPHPDAVWLAGFWRWSQQRTDYQWIAGHWELPPGEGYAWVADPPDPQTGFSIGGHWELRINVDVDIDVKAPRRP
jgi:hypothetical protein